jgi:hypothetical protein
MPKDLNLSDEDKALLLRTLEDLKSDPSAAVLSEVAALFVKIKKAVEQVDDEGMVVVERTTQTRKEAILRPDGTSTDAKLMVETDTVKKQRADEVLISAMAKIDRLLASASMLNREPPKFIASSSLHMDREVAEALIREIYGSTGALGLPDHVESAEDQGGIEGAAKTVATTLP